MKYWTKSKCRFGYGMGMCGEEVKDRRRITLLDIDWPKNPKAYLAAAFHRRWDSFAWEG
jgi:hypothetical protein